MPLGRVYLIIMKGKDGFLIEIGVVGTASYGNGNDPMLMFLLFWILQFYSSFDF
jgi:hypothetical protein